MNLNSDDYAAHYAAMSDSELLRTAHSYDSLTDLAQLALRAEFGRRALDPPLIDEGAANEAVVRELVTVRRYRDLSEAIVARSLLESAGIYVYLRDENLVRLDWQVSNFIGGIRLQVETADEFAALDLLDEPGPSAIAYTEGDSFDQPRCPRCASSDISFEGSARAAALASVHLLSIPLPLGSKTWLCNSCEARWEDDEDALSEPEGFYGNGVS